MVLYQDLCDFTASHQAQVVQRMDIAVHWIKTYPVDSFISSWNALRGAHSWKLSAKNTTWKFVQIMCQLTPHWTDCCFGKATLSWFVSALPKEIIRSPKEMTLEKGLRSQHSKDVQLPDSLGSPMSGKRTSYNFC